jgi:hypothetical protein
MPNIVLAALPGFAPDAAGVAIGTDGRAIGAPAGGAAGAGLGAAAGAGAGAAAAAFVGSSPPVVAPGAPPGAIGALPSDFSFAPGIPKTVLAIPTLLFRQSAFSIASKATALRTLM